MLRVLSFALILLAFSPLAGAGEEEEALAGWDRRFERAREFAAETYEKLARWADKNGLARSGARARRRILTIDPENTEARAWFGYEKDETGRYSWPPARREHFRELRDTTTDRRDDFHRRLRLADRRVGDRLLALGNTADFRMRSGVAFPEKWNERMFRAFTVLLRIAPREERARELLGHPEFEGRRVDPKALPFLKARAVRKRAGEAAALAGFEVADLGRHAGLAAIGIDAHGARTLHFTVYTSWGSERASELALAAERAMTEIIRVNGFPYGAAERKGLEFITILKDKAQLRTFLARNSDWKSDRIEHQLSRFTNAWFAPGCVAEHIAKKDRMVDGVMHYACRTTVGAARRMFREEIAGEGEKIPDLEPWLLEALATDVVKRMTGESLTRFSEFPEYSHEKRTTKGLDRWMALARERVANDDDVPMTRLVRLRLIDLDAAAAVKAYAVLQYLFEGDAGRARKFVRLALVRGGEVAARGIYHLTLDELDTGYREWVILTW
jgi:hypothetical protein